MSQRRAAARGALGAELALAATALATLSRLPVPDTGWEPGRLRKAGRYFGLAGLVLGALSAVVWLAASAVLPPAVAAGLAIGAGMLASGALHEDGLADTADGLAAGGPAERRLSAMRDSRIGAAGALALIVAVGLRWGALASLAPAEGGIAVLLAMTCGRALMVPATALAGPARADGLGRQMAPGAGGVEIAGAVGTACLAALLAGPAGAVGLGAAAMAAGGGLWLTLRALGGYTGDTLGAVSVAAETGALVALAAVWAGPLAGGAP